MPRFMLKNNGCSPVVAAVDGEPVVIRPGKAVVAEELPVGLDKGVRVYRLGQDGGRSAQSIAQPEARGGSAALVAAAKSAESDGDGIGYDGMMLEADVPDECESSLWSAASECDDAGDTGQEIVENLNTQ